jgi:hypothetical protein
LPKAHGNEGKNVVGQCLPSSQMKHVVQLAFEYQPGDAVHSQARTAVVIDAAMVVDKKKSARNSVTTMKHESRK